MTLECNPPMKTLGLSAEDADKGAAAHVPVAAARSLQHASNSSTHMPIVLHEHMHAEHDAMSKQQQQHNVQPVGEERCCAARAWRCAAANAPGRRRPSHDDDDQRVAREQLCHVEVR